MSDSREHRTEWRLAWWRNGWHAVAQIDGRQVRRSLRTADREEAVREFEDFIKRPTGSSLMFILDAYLDDRSNRPSIASMREAWKAAKPFWSAYRPDQITRPLCRDYIALRGRQGWWGDDVSDGP